MAQINLLKQNQPSAFARIGLLAILNKLALLGLLVLIIFWFWFLSQSKSAGKEIQALDAQVAKQKQELSENGRRDEVVTRQSQLKEFDTLISNHLYWSQLLPELAKVTLKSASYLSFRAEIEGGISLSVKLPSIAELDKFLQIFDSAKINRYFSDLKMGGISKVVEKNNNYIRIDVQLKYNPELLKYKSVN